MPQRNETLEKLMGELATTDEPAARILERLGVAPTSARRLLQSKRFMARFDRFRNAERVLRDLDLARAGMRGAGNVLRGAADAAREDALSSSARSVSVAAVRLSQVGERQGPKGSERGSNGSERGINGSEQGFNGAPTGPAITPEMDAAFEAANAARGAGDDPPHLVARSA